MHPTDESNRVLRNRCESGAGGMGIYVLSILVILMDSLMFDKMCHGLPRVVHVCLQQSRKCSPNRGLAIFFVDGKFIYPRKLLSYCDCERSDVFHLDLSSSICERNVEKGLLILM